MRPLGVSFLLLLCATGGIFAGPAEEGSRKQLLFSRFIAPCCWRENLLVHHSPKADELRAEIVSMIAAGDSDEQIKSSLVTRYSLRILALPEGSRAAWLNLMPLAAAALGLGCLGIFVRRSLRRAPPVARQPAGALPAMPEWEP